jgi:hypothetical protein
MASPPEGGLSARLRRDLRRPRGTRPMGRFTGSPTSERQEGRGMHAEKS